MPAKKLPTGMIADLLSSTTVHYQLPPHKLITQSLLSKEGKLSSLGALCVSTGLFTGRSPKDKFIAKDCDSAEAVNWNSFNNPVSETCFLRLKHRMLQYLAGKEAVWIRDVYACAHPAYQLDIRILNETPWSNLFCHNLFLRPATLDSFEPEWHILQAPGFKANPAADGTRNENFVLISFAHKTILIGGTAYTGEIKKSVFTILNYLLPQQHGVLSMHCSCNVGKEGDVALFFGLSGTGKTTLSADPERRLIGDDEHGWTADTVFNLEGGCYAKIINLDPNEEPAIFSAIREGTLVENTSFLPGTNHIDFSSATITENTRASYPLEYIQDAVIPSLAQTPKNIFFLTCDAYGILPPVSRLTDEQALFHFINGYTAKIAGTEVGITEPVITFSACFGAPFLPLHPMYYASLLKKKLKEKGVKVWLINTGWTGGGYGTGHRIPLSITRNIIRAILGDRLDTVSYSREQFFNLLIPQTCTGVDNLLLNPRDTWTDKAAYDQAAAGLAARFKSNFNQYANLADETFAAPSILSAHS